MGEGAEVDEAVIAAESQVLEELLRELPPAQWEDVNETTKTSQRTITRQLRSVDDSRQNSSIPKGMRL